MAANSYPLLVGDRGDVVNFPSFNGVTTATVKFGAVSPDDLAKLPDAKATLTADDDNALMTFFARTKGTTDWGAAIFSIKGFLCKKSGKPYFDSHGNAPTKAPMVTDWSVFLAWETGDFPDAMNSNPDITTLFLPWVVDLTNPSMQLSIEMTFGGTPVTPVGEGLVDILLKHTSVPMDGSDASNPNRSVTTTNVGANIVYPIDTGQVFDGHWTALPSSIPFDKTNGKFNIYIHESCRACCNALAAGSFDFDAVSTLLKKTFTDVGFTNINIQEVHSADDIVKNVWITTDPRFRAKNTRFSTSYDANEGTAVPFFDHYVFMSKTVNPPSDETIGSSEGFNGTKYSQSAATKILVSPTIFYTKTGKAFAYNWSQQKNADVRANFLHTKIAHEIGHALGLLHPVTFYGSQGYRLGGATVAGTMDGMPLKGEPAHAANPFGPVHTAVLKKIYGL